MLLALVNGWCSAQQHPPYTLSLSLFASFYFIQCKAWVKHCNRSPSASATSKGPQVKTTEPMVTNKATNCSIYLGCILARDGFSKNYMGSRPEAKKCHFFIWCVRMYVCMYVIVLSAHDFFHTVAPIEMKLKTYH